MCAINPKFKKRYIIDVYTSHPNIDEEEFKDIATARLLAAEIELNKSAMLRFHLKETEQPAD